MSIKPPFDLGAEFSGRAPPKREPETRQQALEVPERIRNHKAVPVPRPGGSWAARADAVDQQVREAQEAKRAQSEWAARLKTIREQSGQKHSARKAFRRHS